MYKQQSSFVFYCGYLIQYAAYVILTKAIEWHQYNVTYPEIWLSFTWTSNCKTNSIQGQNFISKTYQRLNQRNKEQTILVAIKLVAIQEDTHAEAALQLY